MITTTEIGNIIFKEVKSLTTAYHEDCFPEEEVTHERVVIIVKDNVPETYWLKCFVEVNFLVPDIGNQKDRKRLGEIERSVIPLLKQKSGMFDGTTYTYRINSYGVHKDSDLRCHFLNVRLLFNTKNIINNV